MKAMNPRGAHTDPDARQSQRLKGFLDHILLALIADRPRYGFELIELLDGTRLVSCGKGSVYPLLTRMSEQGLIESRQERSAQTGRKRRYYDILPEGEATLALWNRQWEEFKHNVDSVVGGNEAGREP